MSACTLKTSVSEASKDCCHREAGAPDSLISTSSGRTWTRSAAPPFCQRTVAAWPDKTAIDRPLLGGAALFGAGWGLVGLCPGPAIANLATLSPAVLLFVAAMLAGMATHDAWRRRRAAPPAGAALAADG